MHPNEKLGQVRSASSDFELDVPAQVELVGDVIQIALGLGLAREVLFPIPFFQPARESRCGFRTRRGLVRRTL